jgi:alpha-amylase
LKPPLKYLWALIFLATACAREPGPSYDWNNALVYGIFVRSFFDSDGDGTGDLKGVEMKLDYIRHLGANAIWLMPIFQSPSDHGYDVTDYYHIEEDYGTMEEFRSLMEACDARGIRVILDLDLNHTSSRHPWFRNSILRIAPYTDYYIWRETPPGGMWSVYNQDSAIENGGWRFRHERASYYYAYFDETMPDLNLESQDVREEAKQIAAFWLNQGVHGFRLGAARNIIEEGGGAGKQVDSPSTVAWWREFSQFVRSIDPGALLVGEICSAPRDLARYYDGGEGLDHCLDFPFQRSVLETINSGSPGPFVAVITEIGQEGPPLTYFVPFLSNHDQERIMTMPGKDFRKAALAAVLLFTAPGTPFVCYGEEIGMYGSASDHSTTRPPMQWSSVPPTAEFTRGPESRAAAGNNSDPFSAEARFDTPVSLLTLYKSLAAIRKDQPALRDGGYRFHGADQGVLVFDRIFGDHRILVMMNLSPGKQHFRIPGLAGPYLNLLSRESLTLSEETTLDPYGFLILEPELENPFPHAGGN